MMRALPSAARWRQLPGNAVCLMFHRVGTPSIRLPDNAPRDGVCLSDFRRIIAAVAHHCTPLSTAEFVRRLQLRQLPQRPAVITFDDGFRDNLVQARPVLEEYKVPATVFVTSGFVDRSVVPWPYLIADLTSRETEIVLDGMNGPTEIFSLHTELDQQLALRHLNQLLKFSAADARRQIVEQLLARYEPAANYSDLFLNASELRELAASPQITIGSHTHEHLVLNAVPVRQARADIMRGKQQIESLLRFPLKEFSYPHGGHNRAVRKIIRSCSFHSAMAVDHVGFTGPIWQQLPRTCAAAALAMDDSWSPPLCRPAA